MISEKSSNTLVMGILNLTPDSFYDGNKKKSKDYFYKKFLSVETADIIDIGAESSRPGAIPISSKEEIERLRVIFEFDLKDKFLSIDSYKPKVLNYCANNNFSMINDITGGGKNYENINIAHTFNIPICIMHMKGNPQNMQNSPVYENIIDDLCSYFEKRINYCLRIGYNLDNLIIDPGIGFGKTAEDNYCIISNIAKFKELGCKVLIGLSRKSFLQINNDKPIDRLSQSLAMQTISIINGADIIRTHDVKETKKSLKIINNYNIVNGNTRVYK